MNMESLTNEPIRRHNESELKKQESKFKRQMAGAVLAALTIAGIAYKHTSSEQPDKVAIERVDINSGASPEGESINNDELKLGSSHNVAQGVFQINPGELNIRKRPIVADDNSVGDTNKYQLSGKITVINPVYVKTDVNGSWWLAADSHGRNYFFTGDNGGIVDFESGEKVPNLLSENNASVKIVATTSKGNVASDKAGEDIMVGTIVDIKE